MKAVDIKYDTDGENIPYLPTEMEIPADITDPDDISDYISDISGFCHFDFQLVP